MIDVNDIGNTIEQMLKKADIEFIDYNIANNYKKIEVDIAREYYSKSTIEQLADDIFQRFQEFEDYDVETKTTVYEMSFYFKAEDSERLEESSLTNVDDMKTVLKEWLKLSSSEDGQEYTVRADENKIHIQVDFDHYFPEELRDLAHDAFKTFSEFEDYEVKTRNIYLYLKAEGNDHLEERYIDRSRHTPKTLAELKEVLNMFFKNKPVLQDFKYDIFNVDDKGKPGICIRIHTKKISSLNFEYDSRYNHTFKISKAPIDQIQGIKNFADLLDILDDIKLMANNIELQPYNKIKESRDLPAAREDEIRTSLAHFKVDEEDYSIVKDNNTVVEIHFHDINYSPYYLEEIGEYIVANMPYFNDFDVLEGELADPDDSTSLAYHYIELWIN